MCVRACVCINSQVFWPSQLEGCSCINRNGEVCRTKVFGRQDQKLSFGHVPFDMLTIHPRCFSNKNALFKKLAKSNDILQDILLWD